MLPAGSSSPSRPSRSKQGSLTITRSVGKALTDVMNKEKVLPGVTVSDAGTSTPAATTGPMTRRVAATTREGTRTSRPSLDLPRSSGASSSDKHTPKLVKRPPTASSSFPSKSVNRQDRPSSTVPDESPTKPSEKVSKPRTSLTLRGLSTALQSKTGRPPSALPKYKAKHAADKKVEPSRSGAKKRLSDWDGEKDETKHEEMGSEDDADADFVTVERPISPLPRRASVKPSLPASLSLSPSTLPKKGNVLHKHSSSISSTPPRPSKVPRASPASTTPTSRLQTNHAPSRPASSASAHSQRVTPMQSLTRNPAPISRSATISSVRSTRRRSIFSDDSVSTSSKIDASPRNPFQLPETNGASLLSPPLSPFLEGVSLDSIDAGDVSALLSTIVSPTKSASVSQPANRELPPKTPSNTVPPLANDSNAPPPQTPFTESSLRPPSILTTDPRQSMLSLRQFLENSGDLEHLLSQPLPAVLTPDARERLLSFGFSPGFAPPPFPPGAQRPEPQTPSPVPDGQSFTSISQVLFPPSSSGEQEKPQDNASLIELLKLQLASAEAQGAERDVRIHRLEAQLLSAREVRDQEAAELSAQVSDLEEQLKELLEDREQEKELEKQAENLEARLRVNDAEWEHQLSVKVAQVQGQSIADQERLLGNERRKWAVRSATAAWECARTAAINELELMRSNRVFIEITLASLDISRQQLLQYFGR